MYLFYNQKQLAHTTPENVQCGKCGSQWLAKDGSSAVALLGSPMWSPFIVQPHFCSKGGSSPKICYQHREGLQGVAKQPFSYSPIMW